MRKRTPATAILLGVALFAGAASADPEREDAHEVSGELDRSSGRLTIQTAQGSSIRMEATDRFPSKYVLYRLRSLRSGAWVHVRGRVASLEPLTLRPEAILSSEEGALTLEVSPDGTRALVDGVEVALIAKSYYPDGSPSGDQTTRKPELLELIKGTQIEGTFNYVLGHDGRPTHVWLDRVRAKSKGAAPFFTDPKPGAEPAKTLPAGTIVEVSDVIRPGLLRVTWTYRTSPRSTTQEGGYMRAADLQLTRPTTVLQAKRGAGRALGDALRD